MYEFLKRCFDLLFAICFLVVFSPVYIISWLIIKIVSPGPAIYKAERVGKDGKLFKCFKFRSMRVDSGQVRLTTLENDDRIFPFGKFIRKAKIDEMPQVVNILKGEMTVVGPRPEDKENADKVYVGEFVHILDVKPGLTSTASLYDYTHGELFEDEESYEKEFMPKKLKLEIYYVNHRSFWYDIQLVLRTAWLIIQKTCGKVKFDEPKELNNGKK
ncbi:undecaprenyl-phosphate galactose phosphotransferase [Prevotella communis]|uniref:Undecaprenyl-phosphate galactose phosphotransferase n=1 Tax=Prevotella communis TaxID=2913614 RepID=A0A1G7VSE8_9BACT|nr:sugar transferase [Prevotella communis]SDG62673.1 undecaprenyl-phosphate galactose phosphotransferase [Prevotella communis]